MPESLQTEPERGGLVGVATRMWCRWPDGCILPNDPPFVVRCVRLIGVRGSPCGYGCRDRCARGIISPAYVVMKLSPTLSPGYANYLFRSPAMVAQYVVASRGVGDIQRNLYYPDIRRSIVIVPPPDEQTAIVRFLDHANGKIDGFIRAKRKLIGLLNEQKQVIIHQAVTRTEREIALVQEYRTRLTADIVTGKLDVREAAAKLPDLPPENAAEPVMDEALEDLETEDV